MVNARGTDLRGGRHSDLLGLVGDYRAEVADLRREARALRRDVDALTDQVATPAGASAERDLQVLEVAAGLRELRGPGLVVTLSDAPLDAEAPAGIDENLLVVHQQDIQAVVHALWAGGAEGVSLQGQRLIATTGIKCVGNSVLLQGVPYAPPYRVVAVGDPTALYDALVSSPEVQNYRDYVAAYDLGWKLRSEERLTVPAYAAPIALQYARPTSGD